MDGASAMLDIHICGCCRKEFSELHEFLEHKKYGCQQVSIADSTSALDLYKEHTQATDDIDTKLMQTASHVTEEHVEVSLGMQLQQPISTANHSISSAELTLGDQPLHLERILLSNSDGVDGQSAVIEIQTQHGVQVLGNVPLQALQLLQQQQLQQVAPQLIHEPDEPLQVQVHNTSNLSRDKDGHVSYHGAIPVLQLLDAPIESMQTETNTDSVITDMLRSQVPNHNIQILQSSLTETQLEQQVKDLAIQAVISTAQHMPTGSTSTVISSPVRPLTTHVNSAPISTVDIQIPVVDGDHFIDTFELDTQHLVASSPTKSETKPPEKPRFRFHCSYKDCNYMTQYSKNVERHIVIHTGEKRFMCTECNARFSRSDKLKNHLRIHTGERPFSCDLCDYSCVDNSSLKKHKRIHSDERPYRCQICPYASRNSSQLTVHLRTHTGDKPFMCPECNATFKIKSDLKRHRRMHSGEKPYVCNICDFKTAVNSNLKAHMKTYHCEENMVNCKSCDFRTSSKRVFKTHMKLHQPAEGQVHCKECDYTCNCQRLMKKHSRTHSDERPFSCAICKYNAKTRTCLSSHMRNRHPKEYFARHSRRRKKPAVVVGDTEVNILKKRTPMMAKCWEKFKCDICGVGFVRADSLRSHLRSHKEKAAYDSEKRRETLEQLTAACATVTSEHQELSNEETCLPPSAYRINEEHEYAAMMQHTVYSQPSQTDVLNHSQEKSIAENLPSASSDKMAQYQELQNLLPFIQNNHNTAVWENMQNMAAMNQVPQGQGRQSNGHPDQSHDDQVRDHEGQMQGHQNQIQGNREQISDQQNHNHQDQIPSQHVPQGQGQQDQGHIHCEQGQGDNNRNQDPCEQSQIHQGQGHAQQEHSQSPHEDFPGLIHQGHGNHSYNVNHYRQSDHEQSDIKIIQNQLVSSQNHQDPGEDHRQNAHNGMDLSHNGMDLSHNGMDLSHNVEDEVIQNVPVEIVEGLVHRMGDRHAGTGTFTTVDIDYGDDASLRGHMTVLQSHSNHHTTEPEANTYTNSIIKQENSLPASVAEISDDLRFSPPNIASTSSPSIPPDLQEVLKSLNLPKGTVITIPYGDHQIQVQAHEANIKADDMNTGSNTQYTIINSADTLSENNNSPAEIKSDSSLVHPYLATDNTVEQQ